jgi:hypothetical protein
MYFITLKSSQTGQKFQEILDKIAFAKKSQKAFCEKYKCLKLRPDRFAVFGGVSSCAEFMYTPDPKIWKKGLGPNEFFPRASSKIGKEILQEINEMPKISRDELNSCIGYEADMIETIGFAFSDIEYFGFSVGEDWKVEIPSDCEEITTSKYKELFQLKN